ncbi:MAG: L-threonylcarbamoyladenylate synthase [Planctomycetota bacterium]|nr:L-threonylcarbamoyladenylate synthase [Planctomycetota bacterium]
MSNELCPVTTDVARAARVLSSGGLVAFGTETVYGLGANALNEVAVARVFEAKNRPHFDPLIVHIADREWLHRLVDEFSPAATLLADAFWPGPLTMVLPRREIVPDLVTSGLPTVAVRMPNHPLALELLTAVDLPIAAPSANPFGQISPTTAQHVLDNLGGRIDLILDGGPCEVGVESTVVLMTGERPCVLRHGGVTVEQLELVLGPVDVQSSVDDDGAASNSTSELESPAAAMSPGMLSQHYSPTTPLALLSNVDVRSVVGKRVGLLRLVRRPATTGSIDEFAAVETLTEDGDLRLAAAHFFAALRRLDARGLDLILAESFPDEGLGRALNDRLLRACHR